MIPFIFATTLFYFSTCSAEFLDLDVNVRVDNPGFHKSLKINLTLYGNISTCAFLVKQFFNEHVYVNSDELDQMKRAGKLFTKLDQKIDTEQDVSSAKPFIVWIYQKEPILNGSSEYHSTIVFDLPFHIRYHKPQKGGGHIYFSLLYPTVYVNCSNADQGFPTGSRFKFPCSAFSKVTCEWALIPVQTKSIAPLIVPVGNLDHGQIVTYGTYAASLIGASAILYTMFKY